MHCLQLIAVTMVTVVLGCSPPEGGFVELTPPEIATYAEWIVIGEVKNILPVDPLYGDMYSSSTYGAEVYVQCSYKGGPIPGYITIGAAGFVPGHCTAKDLEEGRKYVLFLSAVTTSNNEIVYDQTEVAEPYTNITRYLDVCGIKMKYPQAEDGMTLKRQICKHERPGPCRVYNRKTYKVETRQPVLKPSTMAPEPTPGHSEVVTVNIGKVAASNDGSNSQPDSGTSGLKVSFGLLITLFLFVFM